MTLKFDLQFFASDGPGGEKTEPATEKKKNDARDEGQVAKRERIREGEFRETWLAGKKSG